MIDLFNKVLKLILAAVLGAFFGEVALILLTQGRPLMKPFATPEVLAYPHVIPKTEDGVALRFVMVHDVIHERFPRHGQAYYRERNRLTRQKIANAKPNEDLALLDDLAVGTELAGDHDEAIRLMRAKLKRQIDRGDPRSSLYPTYANLGTFLILGPFRQVRPGNDDDKATLREGLDCIQTAIKINPDSHFGREVWQAAIIEYMIALYHDPETLLRVDMIGNDLKYDAYFGAPMIRSRSRFMSNGITESRVATAYLSDRSVWKGEVWKNAAESRKAITQVGPANGAVPFDEPTLGIIGMWRLGGGAHPYFAVALGETMMHVGQKYIAWNAFERASRLAEFSWPDPALQERFREHCRTRQKAIEDRLPSADIAKLRPAFDAELAFGLDYQRAYQQYEADQIAAGHSIEDPNFYDAFHRARGPIASPVGDADWFVIDGTQGPSWSTLAMLFGAGFSTLLAALWMKT